MINYAAIFPELILSGGAMALLMVGAYGGAKMNRFISWGAIGLMVVALFVLTLSTGKQVAFNGAFAMDDFARFMKVLALGASAMALILSHDYFARENISTFEFPVLVLLATTGMMALISARDLIALYLALELMSLSLYVIAAIHRDNLKATEAGLKYFVLGALSSGMLLYGASLIYGFTGQVSFQGIAAATKSGLNLGLIFGLVFMLAGLSFKISAVPFHMWTPDVYEGAPTPVTAFFAGAPKVAAMALFLRITLEAFPGMLKEWQQVVVFIAIASMALGAFAAIGQSNIKRLMAYSSIANMGFALVGLAAGSIEGVQGVLVYLVIYVVGVLGAFAAIVSMRTKNGYVENIEDLSGLSKSRPLAAFCLMLLMFSMIGIPPLAGFFAKWYVFVAAVNKGLWVLAVLGVIASVVGCYYYLRIIKIMYFDEPKTEFVTPVFEVRTLLVVSAILTLLFFMKPLWLTMPALTAAKSLF